MCCLHKMWSKLVPQFPIEREKGTLACNLKPVMKLLAAQVRCNHDSNNPIQPFSDVMATSSNPFKTTKSEHNYV